MQIPEKLRERLIKLGIPENIYDNRVRKCILSREKFPLEQVPWYKHAYIIGDDFVNRKDYFIFDPVSLLPCLALAPENNESILDMCAAPGTKTFILSFLTNNEAKITANDIDRFRVRRLRYNVNKFNLSAEVLNVSGRKIEGSFDRILVDAPCSGEGMVNKHKKMFQVWGEKRIRLTAKRQKKLIKHAFDLLEEGGTLVYSTCTFAPEENEEVVDFLLDKCKNAKLEVINIPGLVHANGLTSWNDKEYDKNLEKCIRVYPQHNNTGGFFTAKIRKEAI
jgi:tRNA (cytosine49-C5)-methyltransferase